MKRTLIFLFITLLNTFSGKVFADSKIPVTVIRIKDGDTIDVKLKNNNSFPVRLFGINCYKTSKIHRKN